MRRSLSIAVLALCVVTMMFAKGSTTVGNTATFAVPTLAPDTGTGLGTPAGFGVTSDGQGPYYNAVGNVQSFWGAGGKNYDLVTYNTSRYLTITGSSAEPVPWANSHLPLSNSYQVDFYGVNYYAAYSTMGVGTTAQVHGVLQFHYLGNTYQLDYQSLAVMRMSSGSYHFTSDKTDIPGDPGFASSPSAMLSLVRKQGNVNYGTVTVPIKFDVQ